MSYRFISFTHLSGTQQYLEYLILFILHLYFPASLYIILNLVSLWCNLIFLSHNGLEKLLQNSCKPGWILCSQSSSQWSAAELELVRFSRGTGRRFVQLCIFISCSNNGVESMFIILDTSMPLGRTGQVGRQVCNWKKVMTNRRNGCTLQLEFISHINKGTGRIK